MKAKWLNQRSPAGFTKVDGVRIGEEALWRSPAEVANYLRELGEFYINLSNNIMKGNRYLRASGRRFEELADQQRYKSNTNALKNYDDAAKSYTAAGKHMHTRRIYLKQREHLRHLIREAQSVGAEDEANHYLLREHLVERSIKDHHPLRLAARRTSMILDAFRID